MVNMFRTRTFNLLYSERCFRTYLWKNHAKFPYKNGCQCVNSAQYSVNTKEQSLTSKVSSNSWPDYNEKTEISNEKEFLSKLNSDPDTFGHRKEAEFKDEGDLEEERILSEIPVKKLRTKQYADIIKGLIKERKIKEAIDVLEVRMLKEDRVKPEAYIYNLLLGACGRVGYTKKAFMLYNDMKRKGLPAMGGTYTALFNACANSPWPADGLSRAKHLHEIMIEKGHEPNDTTYHAMIKAFGRCGDLQMAFYLADEMVSKKIPITNEVITFLLQGCLSDKEAGFRHALLVWRKMMEKNLKPSLYSYNTFLRAVRDCGLGDIETTKDVIEKIVGKTDFKLLSGNEVPELQIEAENMSTGESTSNLGIDVNVIDVRTKDLKEKPEDEAPIDNIWPGETAKVTKNENRDLQITENVEINTPNENESNMDKLRPNLMAKHPHLGSLISLSEVKTAEDRLLLVGGFKAFLQHMRDYECKPNIVTFTQLLDCMPKSLAAEQELMNFMREMNVRPDIDFYNMIMKKRSMRCDYEGAKVVLEMMRRMGYRPNVMTYGILAMGCTNLERAHELLEEMKEKKYSLNAEILGAMLKNACYHNNIDYVKQLMELCLTEDVNPNKKFIQHLDEFKKKCRRLISEQKLSENQKRKFNSFRARYKSWKEQVHVDEAEEAHPWQQYRQENDTEFTKHIQLKDTARFKPRHSSRFKVKTSTKVRY